MSFFLLLTWTAFFQAPAETPHATVIIVVGAEGSEDYGKQFRQWAARWNDAA
ncbi:MAG: hypothetical protein JWM11_6900, partial [Planctomycetaceae bacterium]|nr:hypothetical protein [Planctomycetaceae bacterium]